MKPTSPGGFQWKQTSSRQPVSAPQTSKKMKESVSQIRKAYHQVGRRACGGLDPTGMI